jgi:hypothetical protein
MLLVAPLLRDPLVYPPPEPPLAFANDRAGAPMRDNTMMAAMSVVVLFKIRSFRRKQANKLATHLNSNGSSKGTLISLVNESSARATVWPTTDVIQNRVAEHRIPLYTDADSIHSVYGVIAEAFQVLFDPLTDLQNFPRNAFSFSQ